MSTRAGAVAGVLASALFVVVSTVEALTRPAFDITRHAISMLSLGERGWVMVATFLVSGALVVAMAFSLRRRHARPWPALLVGGFGVGLLIAGVFPAPAGLGFPEGTPMDRQPEMTATAALHSVGFNLGFGCLIAACFVFAVRYLKSGRRAAGLTCLAAGVGVPVLIGLGASSVVPTGVGFYLAAVLAWAWLAVIALLHRSDDRVAAQPA